MMQFSISVLQTVVINDGDKVRSRDVPCGRLTLGNDFKLAEELCAAIEKAGHGNVLASLDVSFPVNRGYVHVNFDTFKDIVEQGNELFRKTGR